MDQEIVGVYVNTLADSNKKGNYSRTSDTKNKEIWGPLRELGVCVRGGLVEDENMLRM